MQLVQRDERGGYRFYGSINEMKNWYPLMRIADAEEIGQVIAFLISEKSSYMTGAVIPIDGGLTDW